MTKKIKRMTKSNLNNPSYQTKESKKLWFKRKCLRKNNKKSKKYWISLKERHKKKKNKD